MVPDGVVALNDMLASGVMHAIHMHNLRIPEDISVTVLIIPTIRSICLLR